MSIRSIDSDLGTMWFVADDQGMPFSPGYSSREEAEHAEGLLESSDGMAQCPDGMDVSEMVRNGQAEL